MEEDLTFSVGDSVDPAFQPTPQHPAITAAFLSHIGAFFSVCNKYKVQFYDAHSNKSQKQELHFLALF